MFELTCGKCGLIAGSLIGGICSACKYSRERASNAGYNECLENIHNRIKANFKKGCSVRLSINEAQAIEALLADRAAIKG